MAARKEDRFKNEEKVWKVGGCVEDHYYHFKNEIEYINAHFFGLFYVLNLTDDIDLIIDTLNNDLRNLCSVFIDKVFMDIAAGKIQKNKFLSDRAKKRLKNTPPEEQEKVWERGTRWALNNLYKRILKKYKDEYRVYWLETKHNKSALEILRTTLFLTPERIEIDGKKFVEIYTEYLAADESETKKIHEQAAEAINQFFNGSFPITQEELSKYFILENGKVKVNPLSVNLTDYARLGARTIRKVEKYGGKKETL